MGVTLEDLKNILKTTGTYVNVDALSGDKTLNEQGIDSLDIVELYFNIDDKYGIVIPDEEIDNLKTLNDFRQYINKVMP
jgi:acyl carrier protein